MTDLTAGHPLEAPHHLVGRRTVELGDDDRGRRLEVDVWYPAATGEYPQASYELLPGVAFRSALALHQPPAMSGRWPLVLFSHGRTGMRINYATFCEALAARGAIVVSSDHPGDQLADWLSGNATDDRTNEIDRVADAHLVLHAMLHGHAALPVDLLNAVDHQRVVAAGHSYGAYTALATAAGVRGVEAHARVGAVAVFQPYTRSLSDAALGRVRVPCLLVVSSEDTTTPPSVDADRPWALLHGGPVWRLDLDGAGHQAVSDMALYAELAGRVPNLPPVVRQYLEAQAAGSGGRGRNWRELLRVQLDAMWAFMNLAAGGDEDMGLDALEQLEAAPAVTMRRR